MAREMHSILMQRIAAGLALLPRPSASVAPLLAAGVGLALSLACHRAFQCQDDAQCELDEDLGWCEATGSCSFHDDSCPSGRRYGEHASKALVNTCVEPSSGTSSTTDPSSTDPDATASGSTTDPGTHTDVTTLPLDDGGSSSDDDTGGSCPPLQDSGPVVVTADGEVIEGLRITARSAAGISVFNHQDVTIRNCEIHHQGVPGIDFAAADNLRIEDVVVVHDRTEAGSHTHLNEANILGTNSTGLVIERARVTRGASGISLADTPGAQLRMIEGHDIRGPGPPASFIHIADSDDVVIEDFSCINPLDTSRPGNLIEIHESSDVLIRRGLLDGHNAEFGYGVLFGQTGGQHSGGRVEDVDAIRMTNGAFSGYPSAFDLVFERTRARDNICEILSVPFEEGCQYEEGPNGGCVPGSDGRSWTGSLSITDLTIIDSSYYQLCFSPVWPELSFTTCDGDGSSLPDGDCGLTEWDFPLRERIVLTPCWEDPS